MNDRSRETYWTRVRLPTPPPTHATLVQQIVSSTLAGGSNGEKMTTEELLWILIGINSASFLYFNWRLALHSTVVKNMVKEQPNLTNKPKRK